MTTIKEIDHDSSTTLSDFYSSISDSDGAMTVTPGAALGGSTNGLNFDYDAGGSTVTLSESISSTTPSEMRFRVRADFDNAANSGSSGFLIIAASLAGSTKVGLQIEGDGSTGFTIRGTYRDDVLGLETVAEISLPSGDFCAEMALTRESSDGAADGTAEFFVNGVSQGSVSNVENFNNFTIDNIRVIAQSSAGFTGTCKLDEFLLTDIESSPLCVTVNAFRFLGFATDNENLYVSGLKDAATLELYDYDLATLTESGTASFGSGSDAEIDAETRGIFPVARPASDQILYLRGRDGNNVQVQYNDLNGTAGWINIGLGTATWDTDKYAVGLMPARTSPSDIIAVFSDNDVYRTVATTGVSWVKQGDMPSGIARAAARHPTALEEIVAGGTAAGTVHFSHNLGVSYADASGTAMGTINAFEYNL